MFDLPLWGLLASLGVLVLIILAVAFALDERAHRRHQAEQDADWPVPVKSAQEMTAVEISRVLREMAKRG